jgi:hypothetical protein
MAPQRNAQKSKGIAMVNTPVVHARLGPTSAIAITPHCRDPNRDPGQSHQGIFNSLIQIKSIIFHMVMSKQSHQD